MAISISYSELIQVCDIIMQFLTCSTFSAFANIQLRKMQLLKKFSGYSLGPNSNSANMKGNGEQEQNLYYTWFLIFWTDLLSFLEIKNRFVSRQEVILKRREKN